MKKKLWLVLLLMIAIGAALSLGYMLGKGQPTADAPMATVTPEVTLAPTAAPTLAMEKTKSAEGNYDTGLLTLSFPQEYARVLEHGRVQEDDVTINVFDLVHKGFRVELFRIVYGDAGQGTYMGALQEENKQIAVSYAVHKASADELVHVEIEEYYYKLLDEFNGVLQQIYSDARFIKGAVMVGEKQTANMTYWSVDLPNDIMWEEIVDGSVYQANFYGNVAKRENLLYTIYLGNVRADAVLGEFTIDGVRKTVSVKSYDLTMQDGWTEQDMLTAGTLMDTINDVIQAITSSEYFSKQ